MNLPFIVLFLAALVHASAYVLLARRIEPFMYNFYIVAWWSYIAMADAALALKSKRFLVFNRNLPFLVVLSAAFWCVFELINLRIRNWYYINIPSIGLIRFVGYLLAYGTVIPGIYVTKEAFSTLLGNIRVRPFSLRFDTNLHSCERPNLRPGTPGGSEEPHPHAGTRAYLAVRRGARRSDNEGIHLKTNRH